MSDSTEYNSYNSWQTQIGWGFIGSGTNYCQQSTVSVVHDLWKRFDNVPKYRIVVVFFTTFKV